MNVERLEKLAHHLESGRPGGHVKFDFNVFHTPPDTTPSQNCGSAGCALGELPVLFPEQWRFTTPEDFAGGMGVVLKHANLVNYDAAAAFFEISLPEACRLFDPVISELGPLVPVEAIIQHIRKFIQEAP